MNCPYSAAAARRTHVNSPTAQQPKMPASDDQQTKSSASTIQAYIRGRNARVQANLRSAARTTANAATSAVTATASAVSRPGETLTYAASATAASATYAASATAAVVSTPRETLSRVAATSADVVSYGAKTMSRTVFGEAKMDVERIFHLASVSDKDVDGPTPEKRWFTPRKGWTATDEHGDSPVLMMPTAQTKKAETIFPEDDDIIGEVCPRAIATAFAITLALL